LLLNPLDEIGCDSWSLTIRDQLVAHLQHSGALVQHLSCQHKSGVPRRSVSNDLRPDIAVATGGLQQIKQIVATVTANKVVGTVCRQSKLLRSGGIEFRGFRRNLTTLGAKPVHQISPCA
jgi:hypothetical protein